MKIISALFPLRAVIIPIRRALLGLVLALTSTTQAQITRYSQFGLRLLSCTLFFATAGHAQYAGIDQTADTIAVAGNMTSDANTLMLFNFSAAELTINQTPSFSDAAAWRDSTAIISFFISLRATKLN